MAAASGFEPYGTAAPSRPGLFVQEANGCALPDHLRQGLDVPIGETDATMRIGLSDLRGLWRAVDPVGLLGEVDPHGADRIVRSRRDFQRLVGVYAPEAEFRIVVVGRVRCDGPDLELAARRRLLLAADRSRVERDHPVV